jgi:hypothetical protein
MIDISVSGYVIILIEVPILWSMEEKFTKEQCLHSISEVERYVLSEGARM